MVYPIPTSLSPSRVDAFTSCPMAFRFASIERIPEPPTPHLTKGSLVHRALELLFVLPAAERNPATARASFDAAVEEYRSLDDVRLLGLNDDEFDGFIVDSWSLVEAYLRMEDPSTVREIGLELRLEAQVGDLTLRGVIDRLELDDDGELVVVDYKTGRAPHQNYQQSRLGGVHFYSFLCEEVLGRRPAEIRLMYLRSGETITTRPTAQSVRFLTQRTNAVWKAVARACETGQFGAKQGPLCTSCSYREWCPAWGGDPALAVTEAPLRILERAGAPAA